MLQGIIHPVRCVMAHTTCGRHRPEGCPCCRPVAGTAAGAGHGELRVEVNERSGDGGRGTRVPPAAAWHLIGVYYSVDILPGWMQVVSRFSPATYVLDAVRKGLVQNVSATSLLGDAWPLVVMGVVLVPLGLWVFARAERYAKRTGRLKRVG